MKTIKELEAENVRLRETLEHQKNPTMGYLIVKETKEKYSAKYFFYDASSEFTKKICESLGYEILHEGRFAQKSENIETVEIVVQKANQTGNFDIKELEKMLID